MLSTLASPSRLGAIQGTGLLDSAPEAAFDRITRLVQRCLRVPVALISIVDEDRQFFKSQQGLPEPWCSARETPLSHSFCKHVVELDQAFAVEDARQDPTVSENLAIRDLDVVAYLGVPLRTPDDHVIGSLCAIDSTPRIWTAADLEILEGLGEAVIAEIATRYATQAAANELWDVLDQSRSLVNALFEGSVPALILDTDGIVVDANRQTVELLSLSRASTVGRDVWDVFGLDDEHERYLRAAVQRATHGESIEYEAVSDTADGPSPLSVSVRPVAGRSRFLVMEIQPA